MKSMLLSFSLLLFFFNVKGQSLYFPPISGDNWEETSFTELGWCADQLPTLYNYLEQSNTKAFIVLKNGKIVIEKYYDTFTKDSLWYWASAGKTITSFLIGKAQEEGLLSIEDTTATYLGNGWTSLTNAQEEKITIRHQLTMTTGLDDSGINFDCIQANCLTYLADAGTRWAYHNGPYSLLRTVLENASGNNINLFMTPRLKTPTGMDGFYLNYGTSSVYFSKPRSMARYGLLMLNNGNWDGNQLMNDVNYLNDMITPSQTLNQSYGYLWWLNGQSSFMMPSLQAVFSGSFMPNAPADVYAGMGKNGQILNISPSENLIVVRMGNAPGSSYVPNYYNDSIWQMLNPIMCSTSGTTAPSKLDLQIYPNPTEGQIHINGLDRQSAFTLYGLNGQLVWKKFLTGNSTTVQIPDHINRGIYFIQIKTEEAVFSQKLILN
ncbi:serine hydrolase [Putridiphycobacter roseus]|uniref:Serine hydrolase n=1 Tax=Putridiphycobacter roseus TaxID=2219161 RepID=A0A2W1NQX0_9FLAO|nr:serine hydrolase [Putridiphycobacter roseus]PZE18052.1 serine hydrolase [Putridiphycobacter roseus]